MAPTLVTTPVEVDSTAANTTSLVTPSFTPSNGEVIIVKVVSADSGCVIGACTGGSQTWATNVTSSNSSETYEKIFSTTVSGSPGSMTITVAFSGTSQWHSMVVERWSGAQLAATPATCNGLTSGAPSTAITTTGTNSIVSWMIGDWNAVAPGTPAYRSSATQDGLHNKSTSFYVAYYAYQTAAAAGSQTCGMTAPTGQKARLLGIEIQAAAGPTPITTSETYTLSEADSIAATPATTDAGTLAEADSIASTMASTDTASLAEVSSITATVASTDAGSVAEGTSALALASTDAASLADATTGVTATAASVDTGSLSDSSAITIPITSTDSAALSEASAIAAALTSTDNATTAESSSADTGATFTEYPGFLDAYYPGLTDGNDTSLKSVGTVAYAFGRSDVYALGVDLYCPVSAGTAVTVELQVDTNADGVPDSTVASKVSGTIVSATKLQVRFTTPVLMTAGAFYWFTVYCDTGQTFRYGFKALEFAPPIRPSDPADYLFPGGITGVYFNSGTGTPGNGVFSTSGEFPNTNFNATFYGVTPVVGLASGSDVPITGTDSAALSEADAVAAAAASTDAGSLAETDAIIAAASSTDAAALADSSAVAASGTTTDTGSLGDSSAIAATVSSTDSGTLTDTSALTYVFSSTDTGSLAESSSVAAIVFITSTDSATLDDSVQDVLISDGADATLTETSSIAATMTSTDSGSLSESSSVVVTGSNPASTDTGTLSESSSIVATATATDTGALSEASAAAATLTTTDTGSLAESSSVFAGANLTSTDTGTLSEVSSLVVILASTDALSVGDVSTPAPTVTSTDAGSTADVSALTVIQSRTDGGTLTETSLIVATVASLEQMAFAEASSILAALQGSDSFVLVDHSTPPGPPGTRPWPVTTGGPSPGRPPVSSSSSSARAVSSNSSGSRPSVTSGGSTGI